MELNPIFSEGSDYLVHHGILGMKWGVRHGPPYPLGSGVSTGRSLRKGFRGKGASKKATKSIKNRVSASSSSGISKQQEKNGLTDNQKKALAIAGGVAAVALIAGVGYLAYKNGAKKQIVETGKDILDDSIKDLVSSEKEVIKETAKQMVDSSKNLLDGNMHMAARFAETADVLDYADDALIGDIPDGFIKVAPGTNFQEMLKAVNPTFGAYASTDNCTSCTCAIDLFFRGYQGQAISMEYGTDMFAVASRYKNPEMYSSALMVMEQLGIKVDKIKTAEDFTQVYSTLESALGTEGIGREVLKGMGIKEDVNPRVATKQAMEFFLKKVNDAPIGARFNLIGVRDTGAGHSMFLMKIKEGIVAMDGQTGEVYESVYKAMDGYNPFGTALIRLDNAEINWDKMSKAVKPANDYYKSVKLNKPNLAELGIKPDILDDTDWADYTGKAVDWIDDIFDKLK